MAKGQTTDTFRGKSLTVNQEVYINELLLGKTQREAYLTAYPNSSKWKPSSVDTKASALFKTDKVKSRYNELLTSIRQQEQDTTMWTREQSINTLKYVVDKNKEEIERIQQASEEELQQILNLAQSETDPEKVKGLIALALKQRKQRRISGVHNGGIVSAVAELNKMQGFNEETINMNGAVVFTGEDKLED